VPRHQFIIDSHTVRMFFSRKRKVANNLCFGDIASLILVFSLCTKGVISSNNSPNVDGHIRKFIYSFILIYFLWLCSPARAMASSFTRFLKHTQRRTTVGKSPLGPVISSSQRPLHDNTRHTQQTNIHAPGGIRTNHCSRRAAVDLRHKPRGHWDRHTSANSSCNQQAKTVRGL
jgi:hypothetical protein